MPRFPNTPNNMAGRVKEYYHHLASGGSNDANLFSSILGHRIISGGLIAAPTTSNTQATGAGGTLVWRCNFSYMYLAGDNDYHELAAGVDQSIHNAATPITNGQSITAAIVIYKKADNTKNFLAVKGSAAATAAAAFGPTDAAIQTAVNSASSETGDTWWKLGEITLSRTADTTLAAPVNYNTRGDRGIFLADW